MMGCGVWGVGCGCGMWVVCGVVCGLCGVGCGVWGMGCGMGGLCVVWSVVCG